MGIAALLLKNFWKKQFGKKKGKNENLLKDTWLVHKIKCLEGFFPSRAFFIFSSSPIKNSKLVNPPSSFKFSICSVFIKRSENGLFYISLQSFLSFTVGNIQGNQILSSFYSTMPFLFFKLRSCLGPYIFMLGSYSSKYGPSFSHF